MSRLVERPRLLHVTTVPQTLRFLGGHVEHAKSQGWEVHALSSPGPLLDAFGQQTQIEVHAVPMSRRITPLRDLAALARIVAVMQRVRPTIVDGHTPKGALLAMMAATLCRVPVRIYHLHGLPLVTATGLKRHILRCTEKVSCALAHQVLCVSHSVRDVALAEGLCGLAKIKVLNHGNIDGIEAETRFNPERISVEAASQLRQKYQIPDDALVAGFIGRIVKDKGLIELAGAWKALLEEFPNLHLVVAGPFENEDPLPAEVEAILRTDPRIHLTGYVDDPTNLYGILDLFVLPTYREGFPVVLLEASAMALPIVATRIAGCVDAVRDGETGTLVPVRDADALAQAIRVYLRDPELRRRHGLQGRERVLRDFRPEILRETLFQEYVRLLHRSSLSMASTYYRRWGKRVFDVLVSATVLIVFAPLLLVLAILVRWLHGAPVLFRQVRSGSHQQAFTILKFRTMTNECDAAGNLLPATQRLTRFGRLLRGTSLDELPELLNVLRGDMTLVGPRPLLPEYDTFYSERENLRFSVPPGITGWAQINGRNDLAWDERLECDAWYAESCSFALDLKILFLTVIKVLRRDNVQVDPGLTFGALDEERRQRAAAQK